MTHADIDHDDLYKDVAALVREHLGEVVSVDVGEDYDGSGDLFIVATVVVEGSTTAFIRDRPTGLRRLLRAMFLDRGVDAFPSVRFQSTADVP